ncbi:MAG: hypothetical protein RBR43_08925 [Desulfuromonadaceae bacterium]|nr:hypothetical protein [Desulfuromonas sp.]MDY0185986.1 hypothetical protein [Desulfuromonadaceae bacterium]
MSISERYRQLVADLMAAIKQIEDEGSSERAMQVLRNGADMLEEHVESVGEIPRMRIEQDLSPVLLDAHNLLDRGRLLLTEGEFESHAALVWDLQQMLYRLLNDL